MEHGSTTNPNRNNLNPAAANAGQTSTFRARMVPGQSSEINARSIESAWDLLAGEVVLPEGSDAMLAKMVEAERAAEEQVEDAEFAAEILESKAETVTKETQADVEKRLGRKVAERGTGEPVKAEDMEFWRGLFSGSQDSPASSETECWLHEDCGSAELAHIVVTTARLREPHVTTVCWKGKNSFYAVVDELNAERGKQLRFSSFGKLADAEYKAAALAVQWGIGRRASDKSGEGGTSADEIRAKGKGRRKARREDETDDRPIGSVGFDQAWYGPADIEASPYLIEHVLRRRAHEIADRRELGTIGSSGITLADIRLDNEQLRAERKQAVIELRRARQELKRSKLKRGVPAAERIIRAARARKAWQRRRGGNLPRTVTPTTLIASK